MTDVPTDKGVLSDYIESLLESWQAQAASGEFKMGRRTRPTDLAQFAMVYALSAHVHALAERLLPYCREGLSVVDLPLVRAAFETAITAQWVAQIRDAHLAFLDHGAHQRRTILDEMMKSASEVFREGAAKMPKVELLDRELDANAKAFQQRCLDLTPVGSDAYVIYRILSGYCHPGDTLSDVYLAVSESGTPELRPDLGSANDQEHWTFLVVISLVFAARAVDFFDIEKRRRSELRSMARKLGIASALQPSQDYQQRVAAARQKKRRANNPRR